MTKKPRKLKTPAKPKPAPAPAKVARPPAGIVSRIKVQVGPSTPAPGSMLKAPPKGRK